MPTGRGLVACRHVSVPLPDARGRHAILRVHVRRMHLAGDVDLGAAAAACESFSGAELRALAVRARHPSATVRARLTSRGAGGRTKPRSPPCVRVLRP